MTISVPDELAMRHGGKKFTDGGKKYAETLELWGGLRSGQSVLDIGCGPGRMAMGIGSRFNWSTPYVGFDVRKVDVDFCSGAITPLHPNFRFFHLDVVNPHYNKEGTVVPHEVRFPAEIESMDFCFAASVFTHMFVRETEHYLREAASILHKGGRLLTSWFLIDEFSERGIAAGTARFSFAFRREDGSRDMAKDKPGDAVAHELGCVQRMHSAAGLTFELHRGAWCGQSVPGARHSQDIVTATKL